MIEVIITETLQWQAYHFRFFLGGREGLRDHNLEVTVRQK